MSWFRVKWVYESNGVRRGPFSKKEILELIKAGEITAETRLCEYKKNQDYKTDYPAIKTEFSVCFPRENFIAATENTRVPDLFMWIGVFTPLFFTAILYYTYYIGREPVDIRLRIIFIAACWMVVDCAVMDERGYKPPSRAIFYASFLAPMYFYYRNKQLRRRQTSTLVSAICMLLIIGMAFAWPRLDNSEIEYYSVRLFNARLQPMLPDITTECISASVQKRHPGMKFDVVGHLSDGQEMRMTLVQSWQRLTAHAEIERTNVVTPIDVDAVFRERRNEIIRSAIRNLEGTSEAP